MAKVAGLELLDEFSVYEVVPTDRTYGKKFVDTKCEIAQRGGRLKARVVGREFRFLDPQRDGVFAPASLGTTSRLIDFLVLKEKGQRNNPMVTFVADCVSAFLQTDQKEECYVVPPLEWKSCKKTSRSLRRLHVEAQEAASRSAWPQGTNGQSSRQNVWHL